MRRLSKSQKDAIRTFRDICPGTSDKTASECLTGSGWAVEQAIDAFFQEGGASLNAATVSPSQTQDLERLFSQYRDPDQQSMILADGISQLCNDLQVDPADIVTLVISWHWHAASMGEFTREEFIAGMQSLQCYSVASLRQKLPALRAEVSDPQSFRGMYEYAYKWAREKGQKCLQQDTALGLWRLLFQHHPWPLAEDWCSYVETNHKKAVVQDTWNLLLDFVHAVKPDLSNFDGTTSAWPLLIDEFVEHMRERGPRVLDMTDD